MKGGDELDKNARVQLVYALISNWYKVPFFYAKGALQNDAIFFNVSYGISSLMFFAQAVIMLQIAHENIKIFWAEHNSSSISKDLEFRRHG